MILLKTEIISEYCTVREIPTFSVANNDKVLL
jgi:hypothetical protein